MSEVKVRGEKWKTVFEYGPGAESASRNAIVRACRDVTDSRPRGGPSKTTVARMLLERDGGLCGICGGRVARRDASADHIIPRKYGGPNHPANLRLAHASCNSRRGSPKPSREDRKRILGAMAADPSNYDSWYRALGADGIRDWTEARVGQRWRCRSTGIMVTVVRIGPKSAVVEPDDGGYKFMLRLSRLRGESSEWELVEQGGSEGA